MTPYSDFGQLSGVELPRELLLDSHLELRRIGEDGCEGMVLWAGRQNDDVFVVEAVLTPKQRCVKTEDGLCVLIDGAELHRLNVWLYENRMRLIAQVHSHPTEAYHSETDDAIPIVTTPGGLSLVVPNFARGDANLADWAAYQLSADGEWLETGSDMIRSFIRIAE